MAESKYSILLVDDDNSLLRLLSMRLTAAGYEVTAVESGEQALAQLPLLHPHLIITDLQMEGMDGLTLFSQVHSRNPSLPVIILTAHGTIPEAVEATSRGVFSYLTKPFDSKILLEHVARALKISGDTPAVQTEAETSDWRKEIVTRSALMESLLTQARLVADSEASVLIQGESGTGKELVARAIHFNSPRSDGPFIAMNCSAIPENLLESELFGHAKGAFTGAVAARDGRFVTANGGTLFLDEIGDLPLSLQPKLLRVLQDQVFEPVGSDRSVKVDVRIITATHRDLEAAMQANDFREDLYYRLAVYPIRVPSLRERAGDILPIATHFLAHFSAEMNKKITGFAPEAEAALATYQWPGNIRELQNAVERATIVAARNVVGPQDLPGYVTRTRRQPAASAALPADLDGELERIERDFILAALQETDGIQVKAAERLGIAERSLWHRIKKLGIKIAKTAK